MLLLLVGVSPARVPRARSVPRLVRERFAAGPPRRFSTRSRTFASTLRGRTCRCARCWRHAPTSSSYLSPRITPVFEACAGGVDLAWAKVNAGVSRAEGPHASRPWLTVTGTNGKTTVGMLGRSTARIGCQGRGSRQYWYPDHARLTPTPSDTVELSSFQLHTATRCARLLPSAWCGRRSPRLARRRERYRGRPRGRAWPPRTLDARACVYRSPFWLRPWWRTRTSWRARAIGPDARCPDCLTVWHR